jgi:hypothetical protein
MQGIAAYCTNSNSVIVSEVKKTNTGLKINKVSFNLNIVIAFRAMPSGSFYAKVCQLWGLKSSRSTPQGMTSSRIRRFWTPAAVQRGFPWRLMITE